VVKFVLLSQNLNGGAIMSDIQRIFQQLGVQGITQRAIQEGMGEALLEAKVTPEEMDGKSSKDGIVTMKISRYVKNSMAVTIVDDKENSWKTRAQRLADAFGARWNRREGYIMSPSAAKKLLDAYESGRDASYFGELKESSMEEESLVEAHGGVAEAWRQYAKKQLKGWKSKEIDNDGMDTYLGSAVKGTVECVDVTLQDSNTSRGIDGVRLRVVLRWKGSILDRETNQPATPEKEKEALEGMKFWWGNTKDYFLKEFSLHPLVKTLYTTIKKTNPIFSMTKLTTFMFVGDVVEDTVEWIGRYNIQPLIDANIYPPGMSEGVGDESLSYLRSLLKLSEGTLQDPSRQNAKSLYSYLRGGDRKFTEKIDNMVSKYSGMLDYGVLEAGAVLLSLLKSLKLTAAYKKTLAKLQYLADKENAKYNGGLGETDIELLLSEGVIQNVTKSILSAVKKFPNIDVTKAAVAVALYVMEDVNAHTEMAEADGILSQELQQDGHYYQPEGKDATPPPSNEPAIPFDGSLVTNLNKIGTLAWENASPEELQKAANSLRYTPSSKLENVRDRIHKQLMKKEEPRGRVLLNVLDYAIRNSQY
jgi:hypothetical protein